jgi:pimeloyl-ACP methyl ester carboxylesterase
MFGKFLSALVLGIMTSSALTLPAQGTNESVRLGGGSTRPTLRGSKLHPCEISGIPGNTLCGMYEVPENRQAPSGRKISLNILVLSALTSPSAADPLFVFAGGPGQAATDGAAGYAQVFASIRGTRDIVLIDQRGTGRSNPLNCELNDLNEIVQALFAGNLPTHTLAICRRQLEQKAELSFYTTPVAMDDIDEVRAWLGYDLINIYGASYGTRAALVYLDRHPQHVRSLVIKAVAPQNYKNPLYNPRDAQKSLDRLFTDCEKGAACAKAFPRLRIDFREVLDRLAHSPVTIRVPDAGGGPATDVLMTRDVFAGALRRALLDANMQSGIPLMIQKAMAGDFKSFATFFSAFRTVAKSLSLGMNLSVICAEDASAISAKEVVRETKGTFLGSKLVRSVIEVCRDWPHSRLPKRFFTPTRSNVPALIMSGRLDPDTPPEWGDEVARQLPNSLHLVMAGMSHVSPPKCVWEMINQFIAARSGGSLDLSCVTKSERPSFITQ